MKSIRYVWELPAPTRSSATITAIAIASAPTASPRATVIPPSPPRSAASYLGIVNSARSPLLHAQGTLGLTGEELADERVLGVEELLGGAGLDDPALPQHRDVLGHAPGARDVVGDDDVGAPVLLVDLLDELAQEGGADGVEPGVGLVEEDDVGVEDERPGEAGPLAHPARQLVGHLLVRAAQADLG